MLSVWAVREAEVSDNLADGFKKTFMRSTCMMYGRVLWCAVFVGSE